MKPTIIILHGWGLSNERFQPLVDEFNKRGYEVFAPDFPGFGETAMPQNPMQLADYVTFLQHYLNEHRLSSVVLIGHSFGGRVSIAFSAQYPKSVQALVLTGTPGYSSLRWYRLLLYIALAKSGKVIFSLPVLRQLEETVKNKYYYLVGARDYTRANIVMKQTFKNIVAEPLEPFMKKISCPCLLLWGELDRLVPVRVVHKMHKVIPGSQLIVLPDCDHAVPYKHPRIVADHIESFIRKCI